MCKHDVLIIHVLILFVVKYLLFSYSYLLSVVNVEWSLQTSMHPVVMATEGVLMQVSIVFLSQLVVSLFIIPCGW